MHSFKDHFSKLTSSSDELKQGCRVKNYNKDCEHYGSTGIVRSIKQLMDSENKENIIGDEVEYVCDCDGPTWKKGDILNKTKDQLRVEKL
jgi:hypothetical protein